MGDFTFHLLGRRGPAALLRAALAAAYLLVLAAAAPHQVHHAGERLAALLGTRPAAPPQDQGHGGETPPHRRHRPAADQGAACPLESALAWKGLDLPAPLLSLAPAGAAGTVAPPVFSSRALFDPPSPSIRAPPRPAVS